VGDAPLTGPAIGVDVGGTKLLAIRLDGQEVVADSLRPSPRNGRELVEAVMAAMLRLTGGTAESVGVGVPGLVNSFDQLIFAPNLPEAAGTSLGAALRAAEPRSRW
jgi:predicted NBD/HSP70 family sugar kinase